MAKHIEGVKPFGEFRAPWETEDGTEAEIDKPKLKKYIHNLVTDKAKSQDSRDEAQEKLTAAETALTEAKAEVASANGEDATKKIAALEKKVADLTGERDSLVQAKERDDLRAEVLAGLDPKYAKYVQGETKEDLEKSLESVKADFGLTDEGDGDDGDGDEDEPTVRTQPRGRITNPADPLAGKPGSQEIDFDKAADDILGGSLFR